MLLLFESWSSKTLSENAAVEAWKQYSDFAKIIAENLNMEKSAKSLQNEGFSKKCVNYTKKIRNEHFSNFAKINVENRSMGEICKIFEKCRFFEE